MLSVRSPKNIKTEKSLKALSQYSGFLIYQDVFFDENSLFALSRLAENISASFLH
jgi:hypothetical protein